MVRTIDSDVQISISPRSIRGTASLFEWLTISFLVLKQVAAAI